MNWQEVIDKYPKAWKCFGNGWFLFSYYIEDAEELCVCDEYYDPRDLYDFFDEQGIIIEIGVLKMDKFIFTSSVVTEEKVNPGDALKCFPTRTEAEEAAFTRAFEILEEKLKEGK